MAGYSRQSVADIVVGEVVKAAPLNAEFNAIRDAFIVATGHKHDGTSTEGAYVPLIADPDANNKLAVDTSNNRVGVFVEVSSNPVEQVRFQDGAIVPVTDNDIDLGTSGVEFKNLYLDGVANIDSLIADTADINAGTIDGVTIGGNSAAAGTFTTVTTSGNVTVGGTLDVTGNTTLTANLTISGNTTVGNAATDTVTITADVASPLIPSTDDTYDLGAVGSEWRNLYIDGTANIDSLIADTADINGGTIDGTAVGGNTPAVGAFTTLSSSGTATLATVDINGGAIDGATIGGNSAAAGSFTTLSASSTATFSGGLTASSGLANLSSLLVTGNTNLNGNSTFGNAATDVVNFVADIGSNLIPFADDTYDLGAVGAEWKDLYIDGTANIDSLVADTADINGGTIDGATIGGSTPALITGTTITANTAFAGDITSTGTSSFNNVTTTGNVTVGGNLTVNGTTTTISTTNTTVEDALIELGTGTTGTPTNDAGIVIERGSENNAFIGFDESADKFTMGTGSFTGASTGDLTITTGTLVVNVEGNVTGNLTGNVSGNVTGNVTGNITSTGTSTFSTIDVNGGAIDGTPIGASSASTGAFSDLSSTGTLTFADITDGIITINGFVDEDNMASDSATLVPTQQSVKKYVDDVAGVSNNVTGLTATGAELNVLDGDTTPASVTLVGTDGFPVNDAGTTKLALISDISTYIQSETVSFTNATLTTPTVSGLYLSDSGFVVEGSSADGNETTVTFTNPTADRTITFPDDTGTVVLDSGSGITVNGSVDFGNWTITESGGSLYFATGGTNKMKLDASGNLDVVGDVNTFATIS